LVSNTTSSVDSPQSLKEEGLSTYFDAIVLSCVLGKRKPGAEILIHAAESMKANPGCCAYIGDRPEVDVVAARKAGFKVAVILENPYRPLPAALPREEIPDYFIKNLLELLDIFPDRNRLVITSGKE
jgi:FMN phosphatase YigB (HAD superfamily)